MNENPYELMYLIHRGDHAALSRLLCLFLPSYRKQARRYLTRSPRCYSYWEDIVQEASTTLLTAVNTYREDIGTCFEAYATVISRRRIVQSLHWYSKVLGNSNEISLDEVFSEEGSYYDVLPQRNACFEPPYMMEYNSVKERLGEIYDGLNQNEKQIFTAWTTDGTYCSISAQMGITRKSYDGRLNRLRRKVRRQLHQA